MYICIYVYMYICIYVYMYIIYVCICIHVYVYLLCPDVPNKYHIARDTAPSRCFPGSHFGLRCIMGAEVKSR